EAQLRLIDALPHDGGGKACEPMGGEGLHSPFRCMARFTNDCREIGEELALRTITAERLLAGLDSLPRNELVGDELIQISEVEASIGECMLRRALGVCPVAGGEGE